MTDEPGNEGHHHPLRDLVVEAALDAERATGDHEATEAEARQSAGRRLGRLILGWTLVLVGIAGLPLPGPGWLIILFGLSMLPYVWAERTIRLIRQRIPGIPEDGKIPTRTWVIMGALVAASLGASVWWGLRDDSPADSVATSKSAAAAPQSVMWNPGADSPALAKIYGEVIQATTEHEISYASLPAAMNPLDGIQGGSIDGAVVPVAELIRASGAADESGARDVLASRQLKAFAPVTVDGEVFWPVLDSSTFAKDNEELENAIDGVSDLISSGAGIDGDPASSAKAMLVDLGMTK